MGRHKLYVYYYYYCIIIIRKESCASHPGRQNSLQTLTPLLHQSVKFLGSIFSGPVSHLLSMLRVLMKILSHTSAKKKAKRLKGFKFGAFIGRFQAASWQWRG